VASVAYSPDGRRIVSGGGDGSVRQWDAAKGQPIGAPLEGHKVGVASVAYSPDGRRIVSGGGDGTVRQWDAASGQPIGAPLAGHKGGVASVAYSPDGQRIVSGGGDGMVRLWPAPDAVPELLCAKLTRNMSHQQWREWVAPDIAYRDQCPGMPRAADPPASAAAPRR
jgi:WD40 repeat protein